MALLWGEGRFTRLQVPGPAHPGLPLKTGLLKHHFSGTIDYNFFLDTLQILLLLLGFFYVSYIIGFTLFSFVQASHILTAIFFHKIVTFFYFPSFAMIAFPLSLEEISFDDFIFSWNCSTLGLQYILQALACRTIPYRTFLLAGWIFHFVLFFNVSFFI